MIQLITRWNEWAAKCRRGIDSLPNEDDALATSWDLNVHVNQLERQFSSSAARTTAVELDPIASSIDRYRLQRHCRVIQHGWNIQAQAGARVRKIKDSSECATVELWLASLLRQECWRWSGGWAGFVGRLASVPNSRCEEDDCLQAFRFRNRCWNPKQIYIRRHIHRYCTRLLLVMYIYYNWTN